MPPEVLSLLIQVPIVAVFIWYSDRKDKQFQAFLKEQREEFLGVLQILTNTLNIHDAKTDLAIARMEERTKRRTTRSSS
jgi:hypothetical protein